MQGDRRPPNSHSAATYAWHAGISRSGAVVFVELEQRGQVEIGEDVAVEGEEAVVEIVAQLVGGEADRAGGAAAIGLDGVADRDVRALFLSGERLAQDVGEEAAGEHDLGHPMPRQPLDHVGEKRPVDQRQRRLRHRLEVSGRSRVPSPPTRTIACTRPLGAQRWGRRSPRTRSRPRSGLWRRGSCARRSGAGAPSGSPPLPSPARRTPATR